MAKKYSATVNDIYDVNRPAIPAGTTVNETIGIASKLAIGVSREP